MIDVFHSRMIAEEASVAKAALDKLIYCGMRGEMSENLVLEKARIAKKCAETIMRALPIIEEYENRPKNEDIKATVEKIDEDMVVRLYSEFKNGALVAEKMGVNYKRVYRVLCKHGVMKKRGSAN